jgi:superfamily II DNA helicase RecQ
MKLAFFHIPVFSPAPQQDDLNQFLQQHPNAVIDRQLIVDGQQSAWAICCSVPSTARVQSVTGSGSAKTQKPVDYREQLDPATFARYAKLRELRNGIAQEQNIPSYAIFSNAQLAQMAALDPINLTTIASIEGIGEKRIENYAEQFIQALQEN